MHPIPDSNGMGASSLFYDCFLITVRRDVHSVFVSYKNDMGSLLKNIIYGQHSKRHNTYIIPLREHITKEFVQRIEEKNMASKEWIDGYITGRKG